MPLILTIHSSQKNGMGHTSSHEFGIQGGTIGRSVDSDWVLPDKKRFVSSRHCTIDFRSGCYYLIDTSTNGVYINDSEIPVGRGKPQRLFSGDLLHVGDYALNVRIEGDPTMELLAHDNQRDPVDQALKVTSLEPTQDDLIDVSEITGAIEIQDLLREDAEDDELRLAAERAADLLSLEETDQRHQPASQPDAKSEPASQPATDTAPGTNAEPHTHNTATTASALEPFFRAAGLKTHKLDAKQTEVLMQRVGQVVREMVVGITESLHVRAEQKNALRLSHTTIQPGNNNPLKFAAGVDEAVMNLLFKPNRAYLAPVEAVREAFEDVKMHQVSLLSAMQKAFQDYLERLDPEELEKRFDNGAKRSTLLGATNKLKYWELYAELYQLMAQHSPGSFPRLFAEEFSRAYEQQVGHLAHQRTASRAKTKPAA